MKNLFVFLVGAGCAIAPMALVAQQPQQGPVVVSPDVQSDRRVTLRILPPTARDGRGDGRVTSRILAPTARKVGLGGSDIPGIGGGGTPLQFTKNAEGVWE